MGTSASPLLSGEEEEEQLQTCLSAQLFVSRSLRETEAAGSRKSRPAGPAVLLPQPQVLTPKQNCQPRRDGKGPPSPTSEGFLWGPYACLHSADTRVPSSPGAASSPGGGGGEGPLGGARRAIPGGRVLTGDRVRGRAWAAFSMGAASSPEAGSSPGSRVLPGGRVVQGSTPELALAQTFPGFCLLCLPCELPSPWGPKPLGPGLCISWTKPVTDSLQQDRPNPAPSPQSPHRSPL